MAFFTANSVYFQGRDAKAQQWVEHFSVPVHHFETLRHMLEILWSSGANDVLVFRYQNNPPKLLSALAVLIVLYLVLLKARAYKMAVVWICHNVDQDTLPHHKWIERIRRRLLARRADVVFVLDPFFVKHCMRPDAMPITFGRKMDGSTRAETIASIKDLAQRVDRVILIAGQDGGKYKAFQRIPELQDHFRALGIRAGFVVAGMAADRSFSTEVEVNILRICEPNLRESDLRELVHFVYRENADISIPYTIYAAATAGIPVITSDDSLLAKILLRERIGKPIGMLSSEGESAYDFEDFLVRHDWGSLQAALAKAGISV